MKKLSLLLAVLLVAGLVFSSCNLEIREPWDVAAAQAAKDSETEWPQTIGSCKFISSNFSVTGPAFYAYPQFGSYDIYVDNGAKESISGANSWWAGATLGTTSSTSVAIADGATKTLRIIPTTANGTMVVEADYTNISTDSRSCIDINCYDPTAPWFYADDAGSVVNNTLTKCCDAINHEYIFTFVRVGNELTVTVVDNGPQA